jgi:hypothetical protein
LGKLLKKIYNMKNFIEFNEGLLSNIKDKINPNRVKIRLEEREQKEIIQNTIQYNKLIDNCIKLLDDENNFIDKKRRKDKKIPGGYSKYKLILKNGDELTLKLIDWDDGVSYYLYINDNEIPGDFRFDSKSRTDKGEVTTTNNSFSTKNTKELIMKLLDIFDVKNPWINWKPYKPYDYKKDIRKKPSDRI